MPISRRSAARPKLDAIEIFFTCSLSCRDRIAGYKRPRSVAFIGDEEMPRTATGKILHRLLKARFSG